MGSSSGSLYHHEEEFFTIARDFVYKHQYSKGVKRQQSVRTLRRQINRKGSHRSIHKAVVAAKESVPLSAMNVIVEGEKIRLEPRASFKRRRGSTGQISQFKFAELKVLSSPKRQRALTVTTHSSSISIMNSQRQS